mmetsp:Transcript_72029/g.131906  ORF Transcript_72029/g.131906 Transcript_72029/m.131906 type:complete len:290 (+) Transcript_72029:416-1285(+)
MAPTLLFSAACMRAVRPFAPKEFTSTQPLESTSRIASRCSRCAVKRKAVGASYAVAEGSGDMSTPTTRSFSGPSVTGFVRRPTMWKPSGACQGPKTAPALPSRAAVRPVFIVSSRPCSLHSSLLMNSSGSKAAKDTLYGPRLRMQRQSKRSLPFLLTNMSPSGRTCTSATLMLWCRSAFPASRITARSWASKFSPRHSGSSDMIQLQNSSKSILVSPFVSAVRMSRSRSRSEKLGSRAWMTRLSFRLSIQPWPVLSQAAKVFLALSTYSAGMGSSSSQSSFVSGFGRQR